MTDRRRMERVNRPLRQEIAALVANGLNDPRLRGLISITQVRVAADLRSARVYVSVMGADDLRDDALAGIQSAASYLRRELRDRIALRYVPFLTFELDETMLEADRLMRIIDDLRTDDSPTNPGGDGNNAGANGNIPTNPPSPAQRK